MATVTDRPADPLAVRPWERDALEGSKSDRYLAERFAAASSDFKGMALLTFLLAGGVAAMGWLVLGVVTEHWLVPGGLPGWARWAWLAVGLAAAVVAAVRWLVPLVRYRVNLVYAARAIERDHPELHNDLVNAVLVRERSDESAEAVVKSLRRRAARRLSTVPNEGVVDRVPAMRLAWALAAIVCLACLYQVFAPKSFVVSAARLIAPWSGFAAPSRVWIEPPRLAWQLPGEDPLAAGDAARRIDVVGDAAELVRGRQLVVSVEIDGLTAADKPALIVTPREEGGRFAAAANSWTMPFKVGAGGRRFVVVPGDDRVLDQAVDLVVAAGDARSDRIRVSLVDAPTLFVREVRYEYPAYMQRQSETLAGQGDIRGVEGTRVTVVAASNRPLDAAAIDLGCDGRRDVALAIDAPDDLIGAGTFTLRLKADGVAPEFGSYRFVSRPRAGSAGRAEADVIGGLEHRIEVMPDLAPEVTIEVPQEKVLKVPPDAPVTVRIDAVDPDFGLASVRVQTRVGDKIRQGPELLVGGPRKSLRAADTIVPRAVGGKPGGEIEYRAVAIDTRPENPNEITTEWQKLAIDASAAPQKPPAEGGGDRQPDPGAGQRGPQGRGDERPRDGADEPRGSRDEKAAAGDRDDRRDQQRGDDADRGEGPRDDAPNAADRPQRPPEQDGRQAEQEQQQGDRPEEGKQGAQGQQQDPSKAGEQRGDQRSEQGQQPADQQGRQEGGQGRGDEQSDKRGSQQGGRQGDQGDKGRDGKGDRGRASGQPGDQPENGSSANRQSGAQKNQGRQDAGQKKEGNQQGRGQRDPAVAADGTNDGEAMERILKDRERESRGQGATNDQARGGTKQEDAKPDPKNQDGKRQDRGSQDGGPQDGKGEGNREGQQSGGAGNRPAGGDSTTGESGRQQDRSGGDKPSQGGSELGPKPSDGQQNEGQSGESKSGESKCRNADGKPCGKAGCSSCNGDKSGSEKESSNGQGQQGQGQQGQGQQGQGQQGQGQQGQGQQGQGEGRAGQAQQGQSQRAGAGSGPEGAVGRGGDAGGPQQGGAAGPPPQPGEVEWGRQQLEHARNAADLAVEHLRNSLAAGRGDLLDDLGWTPQQARAFLDRWQAMQRLAASEDPRERAEFERAVRSLGLRPDGVQSSRDVPTDVKGGQAEGRRSRPPSDYRDQFKAFMQGTGGP